MALPISIAADSAGRLAAIFDDGTIARQTRVDGVGDRKLVWQPVSLAGLDGTVPMQIVIGENYRLMVLTRTGGLYAQNPSAPGWVELPTE